MATDAKKLQPIIIKRVKKGGHAAHGGAWKIAYADFVTAMMAFFLLMWLLGSTTEGDKKGIVRLLCQSPAQGGHAWRQRIGLQQQRHQWAAATTSTQIGRAKTSAATAQQRRSAPRSTWRQGQSRTAPSKTPATRVAERQNQPALISSNAKLAEFSSQIQHGDHARRPANPDRGRPETPHV